MGACQAPEARGNAGSSPAGGANKKFTVQKEILLEKMISLEDQKVKHRAGSLTKFKRIIGKILRIDSLPSYREVYYLVLRLGKERWLQFCSRFSLFNVETIESVRSLSNVLKSLPSPVVEVCAGRGKLSYWLRRFGVKIIATDDYSWKLWGERFNVERLSITEALEKYNPKTVLGSWIPANERHGVEILSFPSVEYFVDIGEGPEAESSWMHAISLDELRIFAKQFGFSVVFLPISLWSIAQTDEPTPWGITSKTKVILFSKNRRMNFIDLFKA